MTDARVRLWGRDIGAVTWVESKRVGVFQYTPEFVGSGIELAPLAMPLRSDPYSFPDLPWESFRGLPGLLADALPGRYGATLLDVWLRSKGRIPDRFNPVERLCHLGRRGMGALEFEPISFGKKADDRSVDLQEVIRMVNQAVRSSDDLGLAFADQADRALIEDVLRIGASGGGTRAMAVLAWNPKTNAFRTGALRPGDGFEQWIVKLDGADKCDPQAQADPYEYGLIEYAYYLMATHAGIQMAESRVHHERGRSHFMTRRFDRTESGGKRHRQSLGAMCQVDESQDYSYEQVIRVIRRLGLPAGALTQQFLRAAFNVVARNQNDHVQNIAFLMDKKGAWTLSPAYDVVYAWDKAGQRTSQHQMSLNGKRDGFARRDLMELAAKAGLDQTGANEAIDRVLGSVRMWPEFATKAGMNPGASRLIAKAHRLGI